MSHKAKVIVNPNTNPQAVRYQLRPAVRILKNNGFHVSVVFSKYTGHPSDLAQAAIEEYDTIIAVGGDGTVNEIINVIHDTEITLGILPIGNTNVLARELDYPIDIIKAARLITRKHVRKIDLGKINERYFSMMASCGYDAYTVSRINLKIKRIIRRWAYVWAGVKDFIGYRPTRIIFTLDNGRIMDQGSLVVISNSHFYGGTYQLTPFAEIDDGLLDVLVYQGRSQIGLVRFVFRMIWGQHIKMKKVKYYRAKLITLYADRKTIVQADGDYIGELPMNVSVVPLSLRIFC